MNISAHARTAVQPEITHPTNVAPLKTGVRLDTGDHFDLLPGVGLRFKFVRAVSVARHLLPVRIHSAPHVCQDFARRSAEQSFHEFLSLLSHDRNHGRRNGQGVVKE